MISRSHVIGLALAVGLMLAGGTGLAAADSGPSTPTQTPSPTLCKVLNVPAEKCVPEVVRGAIPKGAPGTGGGGMAAEVGSWH